MKIAIDDTLAGKTVKEVLTKKLRFSRAMITSLKNREHGIEVNGVHRTVRYVLGAGDILFLDTADDAPSPRIKESDGKIDVIFEDEYILCVNKPAGLAVHPSKKLQDDTLAGRILHNRYPMVFRAAGRLDKGTSGVVICSKDKATSAVFSELIAHRAVKKEYILISSGAPLEKEGVITLCIKRDPESNITRVCFAPDGTEKASETAETKYRVIYEKGENKLVLARPVTGRTHQLRAHFSALGDPIVGDTLYGEGSPLSESQLLHAMRLTFPHPVTGETLSVTAPVGEVFEKAVLSLFGEEGKKYLDAALSGTETV